MSDAPPKLALSGAQIAAGALAAITVTLAGSFLGKWGTLAGAAGGSILATTATALYAHGLRHSRSALGRARKARVHLNPVTLAGGTVALIAVILGAVTAVEAATGRPVSALIDGGHAKGTSIGYVTGPGPAPSHTPGPSSTSPAYQSPTPSPSPATVSPSPDYGVSGSTPAATPYPTPT